MATKYWIKFYHEVLDDPKMGRLPDNLWRRFYECCLLAGEAGYDDGDDNNGRLPPLQDVSWRLRVDVETLRQEFDDLARRGLIEYRSPQPLDGYWFITNFDKRQRKMEKSEYMRRLRQERAGMLPDSYQGSYQTVTNGNADTDKKRKEKEVDTEKEQTCPIPTELATSEFMNAWGEWLAYHDDLGKPLTFRTTKAQLIELKRYPVPIIVQAIEQSIKNGWRGIFPDKIITNGNGRSSAPTHDYISAALSDMVDENGEWINGKF